MISFLQDISFLKPGAPYIKSWIGFVIAKENLEWDRIDLYAKRIQKLERKLGIEITDFSDWGII
jgi:hypothetical protein